MADHMEREIKECKKKLHSLKELEDSSQFESEASKIKTKILELKEKFDLLCFKREKLLTQLYGLTSNYSALMDDNLDLHFDTLKLYKLMKRNQIKLEKLNTENVDEYEDEDEEDDEEVEDISDDCKKKLKVKIIKTKATMKIFEDTSEEAKISSNKLPVLEVGPYSFFFGIAAAAFLLYR